MPQRDEIGIKKWFLGGKKWVIRPKKSRDANQTRKAKWCKMQLFCLKTDKRKDVKEEKW